MKWIILWIVASLPIGILIGKIIKRGREMEAKIDKSGYLWLERMGKFKEQTCPFYNVVGKDYCGDWCPLLSVENVDMSVIIELCHGKIYQINLDDFRDERREGDEGE